MPKPQRLENDAKQKNSLQRDTDLLLLDLRFARRTALALESLNPSLESCAESTCLADKIFQQLSIALCRCIVCVVK